MGVRKAHNYLYSMGMQLHQSGALANKTTRVLTMMKNTGFRNWGKVCNSLSQRAKVMPYVFFQVSSKSKIHIANDCNKGMKTPTWRRHKLA